MDNKTKEFAIEVAREVARETYKLCKKEDSDKAKKSKLHNTGLLMNKYCELKAHYENIKYKASDIADDLVSLDFDSATQDDIIIHSIKRSKIRTMIIISQIDSCVKLLEASMKEKNELEKIEAIKRLYMDDFVKELKFYVRVQVVAKDMTEAGMPCSESSVRRWSNEMLNELSVKLFGVDGLRMDI